MPVRSYKPTSAGRRGMQVLDFSDITTSTPEKSLLEPRKKTGGRNHHGRITSRHRGGGHKQRYRRIDFRRDKDGIPAKVATIEYDPCRSARIALLHYADGEKRYILWPREVKVGDVLYSGEKVEPAPGNCLPLRNIPQGLMVHNVELRKGMGGQMARSAGTFVTLMNKESDHAFLSLPSGEVRKVSLDCRATIGQLGNHDHASINIGKAGRSRWLGRRPQTRGSAMNPVDHPMGGGEGRRSGGRHPMSPWGWHTKGRKTRKPRALSSKFIVRSRKKK